MTFLRCVFSILLLFGAAGCATLTGGPSGTANQPAGAVGGQELTSGQLDRAEEELNLAMASYASGDQPGAEQAAVRVARLLYAAEPPQDGLGARYAVLTSKLGLLTVRINRLLHGASPEWENETFTFPVPYNPRIEHQVDHYLTQGRESFARWLRRSGRYVPPLRELFLQEGLPGDLVYLALVESGFNPRNRSSKEAVGLFQFIQGTAEMVGLRQNFWVDERRDPEKAALAAIRHLKDLYREFQNWDLALAAYNAGSGRVWQSIRAQGTRNYWDLALPPETELYVPRVYAALLIAREPELYGFNPELESEEACDEVEVPGAVDLKTVADVLGVTLAVVADLNPELTKGCTPPGPETYLLRLPQGTAESFQTGFAALPDDKKYLSAEEMGRRKFAGLYVVYTVRAGDSLFTIARKHHSTVDKIKRSNPTVSRNKYIFPGQKLRIYRTQ
ncbi:MAG: transglycosylase SLT domain-containing protein [candidate division FCPU426 bacterium]